MHTGAFGHNRNRSLQASNFSQRDPLGVTGTTCRPRYANAISGSVILLSK